MRIWGVPPASGPLLHVATYCPCRPGNSPNSYLQNLANDRPPRSVHVYPVLEAGCLTQQDVYPIRMENISIYVDHVQACALQLKYIFEEKLRVEEEKRVGREGMEKYTIPEVNTEEEWLYLTGQTTAAEVFASTPVS